MSAMDKEFTTMLMGIFMMENGKTTGGKEKECILVQRLNSKYVITHIKLTVLQPKDGWGS